MSSAPVTACSSDGSSSIDAVSSSESTSTYQGKDQDQDQVKDAPLGHDLTHNPAVTSSGVDDTIPPSTPNHDIHTNTVESKHGEALPTALEGGPRGTLLRRTKPLAWQNRTTADLGEDVWPVWDVQNMPYSDPRCTLSVESQADYSKGGFPRVVVGDMLSEGRYEIVSKLGVGHFGVVWLCWDHHDAQHVAIKMVRSQDRYTRAALIEDKLLTVIQGPRDERRQFLVDFLDSFEHKHNDTAFLGESVHVCLVFEVLGMSLLEVLRRNKLHGFPIRAAKHITRQILSGLSYLHSLDVAHTDLKPANIMLYHPDIEDLLASHIPAAQQAEKALLDDRIARGFGPERIKRSTWEDYWKALVSVTEKDREVIAGKRLSNERKRWEITGSYPVVGDLEFMHGRRIGWTAEREAEAQALHEQMERHKLLKRPYLKTAIMDEHDEEKQDKGKKRTARSSPTHPSKSALANTKPASDASPVKMLPHYSPVVSGLPLPPLDTSISGALPAGALPSQHIPKPIIWDPKSTKSGLRINGALIEGTYEFGREVPLTPAEQRIASNFKNSPPCQLYPYRPASPSSSFGYSATALRARSQSHQPESGVESPAARLQKQFEIMSLGLADFQQDSDDESAAGEESRTTKGGQTGTRARGFFDGEMLEMRKPLRRSSSHGSSRSSATSFSGSESGNLSGETTARSSMSMPSRVGGSVSRRKDGSGIIRTSSGSSAFGSPELATAPLPTSPSSGPPAGPLNNFARSSSATGLSGLQTATRVSIAAKPMPRVGPVSAFAQLPPVNRHGAYAYACDESISPLQPIIVPSTRYGMNSATTAHVLSPLSTMNRNSGTDYFNTSPVSHINTRAAKGRSKAKAGNRQEHAPTPAVSMSPLSAVGQNASALPGLHAHSVMSMTSNPPAAPLTPADEMEEEENGLPSLSRLTVKLADLGNAIFYGELRAKGALPEFVGTRQYRAPENLVGAQFDHGVDVWAVACVVFELVTGDLLFNPGSCWTQYSKEDDLLAQQMELLGPLPEKMLAAGVKTKQYFTSGGQLRRLTLNPWSMKDILVTKYRMPAKKAGELADFLLSMMALDPFERCSVDEALRHPWLAPGNGDDDDMVVYRPTPAILQPVDEVKALREKQEKRAAYLAELARDDARYKAAVKAEQEAERAEEEAKKRAEKEEFDRYYARQLEIRDRQEKGLPLKSPKPESPDPVAEWEAAHKARLRALGRA